MYLNYKTLMDHLLSLSKFSRCVMWAQKANFTNLDLLPTVANRATP